MKRRHLLIIPFLVGILVYTSCQEDKEIERNLHAFPEETRKVSKVNDEVQGLKKTGYNSGDAPNCSICEPVYAKNNIDNYLKIKLKKTTDAVLKLINVVDEKCVRAVYLKANDEVYLKKIPGTKHYLKIAYGTDWKEQTTNGKCIGKFAKNLRFEKRSSALDFSVIKLPNGLDVPSFEIILDGTDQFDTISEKEFLN